MERITNDLVIRTYVDQRPLIYWEVGEDIIDQLRNLHDGNGRFLLQPSLGTADQPGPRLTLLGYGIKMVTGEVLRLVVEQKS